MSQLIRSQRAGTTPIRASIRSDTLFRNTLSNVDFIAIFQGEAVLDGGMTLRPPERATRLPKTRADLGAALRVLCGSDGWKRQCNAGRTDPHQSPDELSRVVHTTDETPDPSLA